MGYEYDPRISVPSSSWITDRTDSDHIPDEKAVVGFITQSDNDRLVCVNLDEDKNNLQLYDVEGDTVLETVSTPRSLDLENFTHIFTTPDETTSYFALVYYDDDAYERRVEAWYIDWTSPSTSRVARYAAQVSSTNFNRVDAVPVYDYNKSTLFAALIAWNNSVGDYQYYFVTLYVDDVTNSPTSVSLDYQGIERVSDFDRSGGDIGYFWFGFEYATYLNGYAAVSITPYWRSQVRSGNHRYLSQMFFINFNDDNPETTIEHLSDTGVRELMMVIGIGLYIVVKDYGETVEIRDISDKSLVKTLSGSGLFDNYTYTSVGYEIPGEFTLLNLPMGASFHDFSPQLIILNDDGTWSFPVGFRRDRVKTYYPIIVDVANGEIPIAFIPTSTDRRFSGRVYLDKERLYLPGASQ